ncbi:MAG: hypothetical protein WBQ94_03595 [Terracidiphilus sp.]
MNVRKLEDAIEMLEKLQVQIRAKERQNPDISRVLDRISNGKSDLLDALRIAVSIQDAASRSNKGA